jgi:hypothetical protein
MALSPARTRSIMMTWRKALSTSAEKISFIGASQGLSGATRERG